MFKLTLKSNYFRLILFFSVFNWAFIFSRSILPSYFYKIGLQFDQIMLGSMLTFISILILIIFKASNFLKAKTAWIFAILLSIVYLLLVMNIKSSFQFYLASFIGGGTTFFFCVFYNLAHFKSTQEGTVGHSSAIMFSIGPIISIAAPFLAGISAESNYNLIWIFSFLFFLVAIYFCRFPENFSMKYALRSAISEIKATRLFIFIEGVWEAMVFGIIPVFTLFFIKTPVGYGSFLVYLALSSVLANLLLGRFTDRIKKRTIFLYPITFLLSAITFAFPLATANLTAWIIFTGTLQFLLPLFWNVTTAMVVDAHPNLELAIPGRELMLTLGRILGMSLAFLSFAIEKTPFYIFFFLGAVMFLFPMILFYRKNIKKKHIYL